MNPKIEEKLKKLREYWWDDDWSLKFVETVEKDIKRLSAMSDLANNKAMALILEDAKRRVSAINKMLTYDENMNDESRKLLFRERKIHELYLNRFESKSIEERIGLVESLLDKELEETGLIETPPKKKK